VQGSVTPSERLRRAVDAAGLVAGYGAGVALFGLLVLGIGHFVEPRLDHDMRSLVLAAVMVALSVGDILALRRRRLYPWAARRQAVQTLTYHWRDGRAVGFVWGMDAGFGAGTYRVTSGLWVLAAAVILGLAGPLGIAAYGAGFAAGFLAVVFWPVQRRKGERPVDSASARVLRLSRLRPVAQAAYLALLPVSAVAVALEAYG
jgi:hypothetical protein